MCLVHYNLSLTLKLGLIPSERFCLLHVHVYLCRDGAALAQFWSWLEEEILKDVVLTEVQVADKLLEFRSMQDGFLDTSFDTISGKQQLLYP